jgi:hypothetical protein
MGSGVSAIARDDRTIASDSPSGKRFRDREKICRVAPWECSPMSYLQYGPSEGVSLPG